MEILGEEREGPSDFAVGIIYRIDITLRGGGEVGEREGQGDVEGKMVGEGEGVGEGGGDGERGGRGKRRG